MDTTDECTPDAEATVEAHKRLDEATERANFHRHETERYERCARAEAARLSELQSPSPVPVQASDEYIKGAQERTKVGGGMAVAASR
jgi:hypothetical protein